MDMQCAHSAPLISIVIPAFKPQFLAAALASLAAQTDPAFEVVVADDASPSDLASICRPFAERLQLRYLRFDENLGANNLVAHWTRALNAATHDRVWLMGDDDALERRCVEHVRKALAAEPDWPGLWHLDVKQIDATGQVTKQMTPYPLHLSALAYVRQRCENRISSFACEYIFSRATLRQRGGFVDFPLAWCSDNATWIRLAGDAGLRTIKGEDACARWRLSDSNISGGGGLHLAMPKLQACLQYIEWLHGAENRALLQNAGRESEGLGALCVKWFVGSLHSTRTRVPWQQMPGIARRLARATGQPWLPTLLELARQRRWTQAALQAAHEDGRHRP